MWTEWYLTFHTSGFAYISSLLSEEPEPSPNGNDDDGQEPGLEGGTNNGDGPSLE